MTIGLPGVAAIKWVILFGVLLQFTRALGHTACFFSCVFFLAAGSAHEVRTTVLVWASGSLGDVAIAGSLHRHDAFGEAFSGILVTGVFSQPPEP